MLVLQSEEFRLTRRVGGERNRRRCSLRFEIPEVSSWPLVTSCCTLLKQESSYQRLHSAVPHHLGRSPEHSFRDREQ
jgi:hypothetical protein